MKSPRPGSRKAIVFAAFQQEGERAALDKGAALKLAVGTIRSWIGSWKKKSNPMISMNLINPKVQRILEGPQQKELVYEITYPRTRGVVIKAGEQVSEVKWERVTPWGKQSFVQNKYLRPASVKPETVE